MGAGDHGLNPIERFRDAVVRSIDGPITWFRESVVKPNQKQYPWYHERFHRVPTVDQCYTDDPVCIFEADQQFRRDKLVENEILSILRQRFEDCVLYEAPDHVEKCRPLREYYLKAEENWFTKYGDLGANGKSKAAFMKQKHRMIWERRHGPVGSGMKSTSEVSSDE